MQLDMTLVICNVIPASAKVISLYLITLPQHGYHVLTLMFQSFGRTSQNTHNVNFYPCYDDGLNNE